MITYITKDIWMRDFKLSDIDIEVNWWNPGDYEICEISSTHATEIQDDLWGDICVRNHNNTRLITLRDAIMESILRDDNISQEAHERVRDKCNELNEEE